MTVRSSEGTFIAPGVSEWIAPGKDWNNVVMDLSEGGSAYLHVEERYKRDDGTYTDAFVSKRLEVQESGTASFLNTESGAEFRVRCLSVIGTIGVRISAS